MLLLLSGEDAMQFGRPGAFESAYAVWGQAVGRKPYLSLAFLASTFWRLASVLFEIFAQIDEHENPPVVR
jgi:hypothetical protein